MPHSAHLTAVFDGVSEWRSDAGIDLGVKNSQLWSKPAPRRGSPTGLERPDGGAPVELRIESEALETWNAGEHLASDTAGAEESEGRVALRSPVRDPQRCHFTAGAAERLCRPFLRNANVYPGLEQTPERTGRSRIRDRGIDDVRDLEAIATVRWLPAGLRSEIILHLACHVAPHDAPRC